MRQRAAVAQDEYSAVTCGRSVIWSYYHVMCSCSTEFCEFYDFVKCRSLYSTNDCTDLPNTNIILKDCLYSSDLFKKVLLDTKHNSHEVRCYSRGFSARVGHKCRVVPHNVLPCFVCFPVWIPGSQLKTKEGQLQEHDGGSNENRSW